MSPGHHPSDETLIRHAAGKLVAGLDFVVATHLAGCERCRNRVTEFEAVGGALLEDLPPTLVAPDMLTRVLARIDAQEPETFRQEPGINVTAIPGGASLPSGIVLPPSFSGCEIGRWHWLTPGIHWAKVSVARASEANVMLLRVGPKRKLPGHGHTGLELTHVLHGSVSDHRGRYQAGDLMEADANIDHQPIVDPGGECICVAAMEGRMRLRGLLGWVLQPFGAN